MHSYIAIIACRFYLLQVRMLEAELRILKGESGTPDKLPKRAKPPTSIKCPGLELIGARRLTHTSCTKHVHRARLYHNNTGHGEFPSVMVKDLTAPHLALTTRLKEGKNLLCARFSTGGLLAIGSCYKRT